MPGSGGHAWTTPRFREAKSSRHSAGESSFEEGSVDTSLSMAFDVANRTIVLSSSSKGNRDFDLVLSC